MQAKPTPLPKHACEWIAWQVKRDFVDRSDAPVVSRQRETRRVWWGQAGCTAAVFPSNARCAGRYDGIAGPGQEYKVQTTTKFVSTAGEPLLFEIIYRAVKSCAQPGAQRPQHFSLCSPAEQRCIPETLHVALPPSDEACLFQVRHEIIRNGYQMTESFNAAGSHCGGELKLGLVVWHSTLCLTRCRRKTIWSLDEQHILFHSSMRLSRG
jgi:hypothetical protein